VLNKTYSRFVTTGEREKREADDLEADKEGEGSKDFVQVC